MANDKKAETLSKELETIIQSFKHMHSLLRAFVSYSDYVRMNLPNAQITSEKSTLYVEYTSEGKSYEIQFKVK